MGRDAMSTVLAGMQQAQAVWARSIKILRQAPARPSLSAATFIEIPTDTLGHDMTSPPSLRSQSPRAPPRATPSASHAMFNFSRNSPVPFPVRSTLPVARSAEGEKVADNQGKRDRRGRLGGYGTLKRFSLHLPRPRTSYIFGHRAPPSHVTFPCRANPVQIVLADMLRLCSRPMRIEFAVSERTTAAYLAMGRPEERRREPCTVTESETRCRRLAPIWICHCMTTAIKQSLLT